MSASDKSKRIEEDQVITEEELRYYDRYGKF
jgi:hypothetical protein